ncbi:MAG: alpha/beta fold hydrolase [Planctomycetes bacterium]|nr:alpha/beta fold hydrolase [Planctomycetota bacterium]MCB9902799.1 alpha/beta fold hydrolase [Planctomycetota bacterium]
MLAHIHADRGTGRAVVYVPGIDATGELMLGTSERIESEFRLLRLAYTADVEDDSYVDLAASIARAVREAGVVRALVLGESFGVAVALRTALDHPDLVAGLALVNGFAHYRRRAALAWSRFSAPLVPTWAFQLGRSWFAAGKLFAKDVDEDTLRRFHELPPSEGFDQAYMRRMAMIASLDLRPELHRIAQPVSLFASTDDHVVASLEEAREMAALLPNAELHVLEGAGHVVLPMPDEPWVDRLRELEARAFSHA